MLTAGQIQKTSTKNSLLPPGCKASNQHKNRCPHVWETPLFSSGVGIKQDVVRSLEAKKPTRNNPIFRSNSKTLEFPCIATEIRQNGSFNRYLQ